MNGHKRTKRAIDIGHAAADYQLGPKRDAYIDQACRGDSELKEQVLDYLRAGEVPFDMSITRAEVRMGEQAGSRMQSVLGDGSFGVAPGTRLGPYKIVNLIGEGGMGEVYKALDTRLDRVVALKVAKTEFSVRFALEARAAASLNHSNICSLYDVGANYLVMEYIEGAPIKGPLPVDQVLRYAAQICDALDAAHRKGITHRDLKPDNILVTKSGVKLLDFGLAKIEPSDGAANGAAVSETMTAKNEIIGTLRYMSPEQLRGNSDGRKIDGRSDIFSFGLVLYELLTGKRAFAGTSPADVIAAILERPAPSIAGIAPAALDRLLQRCLHKDPDERWQSARDLKAELEWIASSPAAQPNDGRLMPRGIGGYALWMAALACLIGGVAVTFLSRNGAIPWLGSRIAAPQQVTRTTIMLPDRSFFMPALSRDGTRLLYGQGSGPGARLWLRMMDQLEAHSVPGTEDGVLGTFSPDGHWIVFFKGPAPVRLAKVPVNGGNPVILSSSLSGVMTLPYWADDDSILAGTEQGLVRVPAGGGSIESLTTVDRKKNEIGHFEPILLPGGHAVLFTVATGSSQDTARDTAQIGVLDLRSHAYQVLHVSGSTPRYAPTGHLVYRRGASLYAVPFDVPSLRVTGAETPVLEGLTTGLVTGASPYSFAQSGLLVYRSGNEPKENMSLAWMDPKGFVQPVPEPPHPWQTVHLSPDGRRVAADIPDSGEGVVSQRIFTYDLDRNILARLTPDERDYERDYDPVWSNDGASVTFGSFRGGKYGMYQLPADASKKPELLLATETMSWPNSWAPGGKLLLYYQFEQSKPQLFLLPVLPDHTVGTPRRFHPDAPAPELQAVVSPDGKFVAYTSNHSGRFEIYVSPFPGPGETFLVSNRGGRLPKWSPNSRELFYVELNPGRLMTVQISTEPSFRSSTPRPLFIIRNDSGHVSYNVAPDGKRFLVLMLPQDTTSSSDPATFVVVTGWFDELARRAPLRK